MRTRFGATAVLAALILALPSSGTAQGRPIELGIDAGGTLDLSADAVAIGVPVQDFRAGFFISEALSVEPRLALNYLDGDGGSSVVTVSAQLGPMIHFSPDRGRTQGYVRPFGGLNFLKVGSESDTQFAVAGAVGVKIPVAERLATRLEGSFPHGFETSNFSGPATSALPRRAAWPPDGRVPPPYRAGSPPGPVSAGARLRRPGGCPVSP